jgi:hypothetical protein
MKYVKLAYIKEWCESQEFSWPDFKRRVADRISNKWILVVLAKLSSSFSAGLQWLSFDERLLLDTNSDISQEIDEYIAFEEELKDRHCPDWVAQAVQPVISDFLKDFSLGLNVPEPKFGPGAVAEIGGRQPAIEKVVNMVYDPSVCEKLCSLFACEPDDLFLGRPGKAVFRNRIIFRPKNALSHRIISAEPTWLTWVQQALKVALFDYVERHPRMYTWFSDQERSRTLALRGSLTGDYATIDYSSASDSVTVELVATLFRDTYVVDALLSTRSLEAEMPDGRIVRLRKFAPMGSATCFVTMDIILLSLCEVAVRQGLGRPGTPNDYTVYGDDVVIRSELVPLFLELSSAIGMTVNSTKSYTDVRTPHHYREACGIEAMDGVDVTPVRYSRFQEPILRDGPVEPEWWASTIDLCNRLIIDAYYPNTRSVVIECIKHSIARAKQPQKRKLCQSIWDSILRVDRSDYQDDLDGPLAMVVPDGTATNYRSRKGYCKDLQRPYTMVRSPVARPLDVHSVNRESELLNYWFFKAQTGLPNKRDRKFWDLKQIAEVQGSDGSLLGAAAGTLPLVWGWVRYLQ